MFTVCGLHNYRLVAYGNVSHGWSVPLVRKDSVVNHNCRLVGYGNVSHGRSVPLVRKDSVVNHNYRLVAYGNVFHGRSVPLVRKDSVVNHNCRLVGYGNVSHGRSVPLVRKDSVVNHNYRLVAYGNVSHGRSVPLVRKDSVVNHNCRLVGYGNVSHGRSVPLVRKDSVVNHNYRLVAYGNVSHGRSVPLVRKDSVVNHNYRLVTYGNVSHGRSVPLVRKDSVVNHCCQVYRSGIFLGRTLREQCLPSGQIIANKRGASFTHCNVFSLDQCQVTMRVNLAHTMLYLLNGRREQTNEGFLLGLRCLLGQLVCNARVVALPGGFGAYVQRAGLDVVPRCLQSLSQRISNFFKSVSDHLPALNADNDYIQLEIPCVPSKYVIPVEKVEKQLRKLDTSKAPGPDSVPSWVLKEFSQLLAGPIAAIYNSSLREGHVPRIWRAAYVSPLPKKETARTYRNRP